MIPALIILEGNISAGKTSLARDLAKLLDYKVFLEPTVTNPYLDDFYADPPKYALVMQIWLLKQRFRIYISAVKYALETGKGVILDRSVFSDWVFAEKNRVDGNISEEGYKEYLAMREVLLAHLPVPQLTVFLDVSPSECYRRVHHLRGRDCEAGIPLDYLAGLDECYRAFLQKMENIGSKIISVPWNSFGNSNAVAQQVRSQAPYIAPLSEMVDVEQLRNYIYQNPFVLEILNEGISSDKKEQEYLEQETTKTTQAVQHTPSTSTQPSNPPFTHSSSSSPSKTKPTASTFTPPKAPPMNFSPSKSPLPISSPLAAN